MTSIRQHIPNFIDINAPYDTVAFETLDELLNISWVKRWDDTLEGSLFSGFSEAPHGNEFLLVANWENGQIWVVGYLSESVGL